MLLVSPSERWQRSECVDFLVCPTSHFAHDNSRQDHDTKDGISLLSLKHHVQMSYLQSLVLLSAHRVLGHALTDRRPPSQPFSSAQRDERGANPGDLVDSMIEGRIVLEKIKALESKMKYQIEKLVRLAEEPATSTGDDIDGSLFLI